MKLLRWHQVHGLAFTLAPPVRDRPAIDHDETDEELRARIIEAHGMWGAFGTAVSESHGLAVDSCARVKGLRRMRARAAQHTNRRDRLRWARRAWELLAVAGDAAEQGDHARAIQLLLEVFPLREAEYAVCEGRTAPGMALGGMRSFDPSCATLTFNGVEIRGYANPYAEDFLRAREGSRFRYHHHAHHAVHFDPMQSHATDTRGTVHDLTGGTGNGVLHTRCERADWTGAGPMTSTNDAVTCLDCLGAFGYGRTRSGTIRMTLMRSPETDDLIRALSEGRRPVAIEGVGYRASVSLGAPGVEGTRDLEIVDVQQNANGTVDVDYALPREPMLADPVWTIAEDEL